MPRIRALIIGCLALVLLLAAPVWAQPTPLNAPLVASTSATLDHILLYDLTGGRRELRFDWRDHYVWGFTPDGCRIVYTLTEPGGSSRLYSARLDGGDARPLVDFGDLPEADWSAWEPDIHPTDGRIVFTWFRRETPPGRPAHLVSDPTPIVELMS